VPIPRALAFSSRSIKVSATQTNSPQFSGGFHEKI